MKKQYAIFDLDGTLLDSMYAWKHLGQNYLLSRGIVPPKNLRDILKEQTLEESAEYFKTQLGIPESTEQILAGIHQLIAKEYSENIPPKPFVCEYLKKLHKEKQTLCIATATPAELAVSALKRLELNHFFSFVLDCSEAGNGKNSPDIYLLAAERMGADVEDCVVYEDTLHAARTAKKAGFQVVGVKDRSSLYDAEQLKKLCDRFIVSYSELI